MTLPFALVFLLGVAAAVYFVVRGVERRKTLETSARVDEFGRESGPGTISLRAPVVAASLMTCGLAGYLAVRSGLRGLLVPGTIGVAVGLLAGILAARLVARWARYAVVHDIPDQRFVLQGHVAKVIRGSNDGAAPAEIEYTANGRRVRAPARAIGNASLTAGSDVVIERLEDGIVFVDTWKHIEQRL